MRVILAMAVCVVMLAAIPCEAAPLAAKARPAELGNPSSIVLVAGGCGPGFHPRRWQDRYGYWHEGRCVPN